MTMHATTIQVGAARLAAALLTVAGVLVAGVRCPAADRPAAQQEILALTGGKRVKVVWNQDNKVKHYDSKTGVIEDLPFPAGSAPLLSLDGQRVFVSTGKAPAERSVLACDLATKKVVELAKGPGNNLLAVWQDSRSGREWIHVNDAGDKNEGWNVPAGAIHRFPLDKPAARELFWDRTPSHIYLMFSADGTRACFEPTWSNIGQLMVAYADDGTVDQDKSDFKTFGGGCFPSLAPDDSYRLFRLDGDHHSITMHEADGSGARKIPVSDMPGVKDKGHNTWLTRWSTHPRFMTLVAPAGNNARIWLLRFDEGFTKIEGAVPVTNEGAPQCWQSHAWVETDDDAPARGGKPARKPAP